MYFSVAFFYPHGNINYLHVHILLVHMLSKYLIEILFSWWEQKLQAWLN